MRIPTIFVLVLVAAQCGAEAKDDPPFNPNSEVDWNEKWCKQIGGEPEHRLESGQRIDCKDFVRGVAWEMDWAKSPKYLECIGQALSYARQSSLVAGCVLIVREPKECVYFNRLWTEVLHHNFRMRVASIPLSCDWRE